MSVLIEGLKMPEEGFIEILIRDDGTVQQTGQSYRINGTDYYTPYVGEFPIIYNAIPIQPHGRLIDADALRLSHCAECILMGETCSGKNPDCWSDSIYHIDHAPTIIEAEGSEEDEDE